MTAMAASNCNQRELIGRPLVPFFLGGTETLNEDLHVFDWYVAFL